jgi:hypothetical protein
MPDTCYYSYLVVSSTLVGFFGDAILQLGTPVIHKDDDWGLKKYFEQHGIAESLCIAAGMMALFYIFYLFVLRIKPDWKLLAIYGIILDYIFRKTMVFPSLDDYYKKLNYFQSALWGAIPMVLPLVPFMIFKKIQS